MLYLPASWNSHFSKLYTVFQMLWCCPDSRAILNDGQEQPLGCGGWGGEGFCFLLLKGTTLLYK